MERFEDKVWGDNDQDGLKFAILFFIQTIIFSESVACQLSFKYGYTSAVQVSTSKLFKRLMTIFRDYSSGKRLNDVNNKCVINNNIKANLIKYLHEHVYKVFRESTCFGHYMQMHRCCVHGQIHRCCMALELNCSSRQAFIIRVHGSILRFTLREVALISGLNCVSDEEFNFDTQEPNRLIS
ncbi:hypothetical protein H5410_056964 [Solanum commersonii]|uniref:Uncharacterized protein n=1 Tax=Solanum commersonii TaxID=4109 RepID=A0A9J5WPJ8_SOLCO|nr:hypothetical protein H5410_056964 [Solanum commersonii]